MLQILLLTVLSRSCWLRPFLLPHSLTLSLTSRMISSPGLRVPEPLTQTIPTSRTSWREVRQPYETLDSVPDLSTVRFELDVSLLVYQPLNYITVTLDWRQIDTKEYTVDDLKDVIYSPTSYGLLDGPSFHWRFKSMGNPTHLHP